MHNRFFSKQELISYLLTSVFDYGMLNDACSPGPVIGLCGWMSLGPGPRGGAAGKLLGASHPSNGREVPRSELWLVDDVLAWWIMVA